MASISLLSISFLSLTLLFSLFTTTATSPAILRACNATRFPSTCISTLSNSTLPPNPTPLQILQSSIHTSSANLVSVQSLVNSILNSSASNPNLTIAAQNCLEVLKNADYRISSTVTALPRRGIKDARARMTAALSYEFGCVNGLKNTKDKSLDTTTVSFLDSVLTWTSNTLSMLRSYDLHGNDTSAWGPPTTERDGFWEQIIIQSSPIFKTEFPSSANVTVCKSNGTNRCYNSIQDAVNTAPEWLKEKFVVYIKEGVYEETVRIPLEKKNVVFIGDGMGKTVITGSLSVDRPGASTYNTATVGVLGDGFMARNLTIQNTAGPPTKQAVAFRSDSDLSVMENVEFLGNQDTLYPHSLRQYYKSCRIVGNVDFIFGNAAAVFEDCKIFIKERQENPDAGEQNAIAAHGRTDPAQSTGFVFQNCSITGTEAYMKLYNSKLSVHKSYLGRPWKEYARTVFINCFFDSLINPEGWMPWSGDFALKTLYFGELNNKGPGSKLNQRVNWCSQIPKEHADSYSIQNFIQGDEWIPASS